MTAEKTWTVNAIHRGTTTMPPKNWKPRLASPKWGDLQRMADVVLRKLGGPAGAADALPWESFYALSVLAALDLDEDLAKIPILEGSLGGVSPDAFDDAAADVCPHCGEEGMDYGDLDPVEGGDIQQKVGCDHCGEQRMDIFRLVEQHKLAKQKVKK